MKLKLNTAFNTFANAKFLYLYSGDFYKIFNNYAFSTLATKKGIYFNEAVTPSFHTDLITTSRRDDLVHPFSIC